MRIAKEALTFDDVLLVPAESEFTPDQTDTRTRLTAVIDLGIPLISAAMDTVTENGLAIAMAQAGGIGVIHKNMDIEEVQTAHRCPDKIHTRNGSTEGSAASVSTVSSS